MTFETLKGTKDNEPQDEIQLQEVFSTIKQQFEKYGFVPFDTPMIEYLDTLTFKYDEEDEIVQEIFRITDRGNRKLGLRYDLTTPLSRYVASRPQLKKPFKRYQIGKVFRDGPLKKGRMREFYQSDGDVIGVEGRGIEAEMLDMFYSTYTQLGINTVIELNNNKILRGALLQVGCSEENLSSYILSIDKLKKIKEKGVIEEIKEKGLDEKKAKQAIEILTSKTFDELEEKATNELLKTGIEELKELIYLTERLSINTRINFSLSRGLDIYTGNIWESYDTSNLIPSSLGAGGRYDNVIAEYMETSSQDSNEDKVPAVGISFGITPILACIDKKEKKNSLTQLAIVPLKEDIVPIALQLAKKYREEKSINTEVLYEYSLKKAFKYTDFKQIEQLIVLGEKDIEKGKYILKNLKTKEEEEIIF